MSCTFEGMNKEGLLEKVRAQQAAILATGLVREVRILDDRIEIDFPETELPWKKPDRIEYYRVEPLTLTLWTPGAFRPRGVNRETEAEDIRRFYERTAFITCWYTDPNYEKKKVGGRTLWMHPHLRNDPEYQCFNQWEAEFRKLFKKGDLVGFITTFSMFLSCYDDREQHIRHYIPQFAEGRKPIRVEPIVATPAPAPEATAAPEAVATPVEAPAPRPRRRRATEGEGPPTVQAANQDVPPPAPTPPPVPPPVAAPAPAAEEPGAVLEIGGATVDGYQLQVQWEPNAVFSMVQIEVLDGPTWRPANVFPAMEGQGRVNILPGQGRKVRIRGFLQNGTPGRYSPELELLNVVTPAAPPAAPPPPVTEQPPLRFTGHHILNQSLYLDFQNEEGATIEVWVSNGEAQNPAHLLSTVDCAVALRLDQLQPYLQEGRVTFQLIEAGTAPQVRSSAHYSVQVEPVNPPAPAPLWIASHRVEGERMTLELEGVETRRNPVQVQALGAGGVWRYHTSTRGNRADLDLGTLQDQERIPGAGYQEVNLRLQGTGEEQEQVSASYRAKLPNPLLILGHQLEGNNLTLTVDAYHGYAVLAQNPDGIWIALDTLNPTESEVTIPDVGSLRNFWAGPGGILSLRLRVRGGQHGPTYEVRMNQEQAVQLPTLYIDTGDNDLVRVQIQAPDANRWGIQAYHHGAWRNIQGAPRGTPQTSRVATFSVVGLREYAGRDGQVHLRIHEFNGNTGPEVSFWLPNGPAPLVAPQITQFDCRRDLPGVLGIEIRANPGALLHLEVLDHEGEWVTLLREAATATGTTYLEVRAQAVERYLNTDGRVSFRVEAVQEGRTSPPSEVMIWRPPNRMPEANPAPETAEEPAVLPIPELRSNWRRINEVNYLHLQWEQLGDRTLAVDIRAEYQFPDTGAVSLESVALVQMLSGQVLLPEHILKKGETRRAHCLHLISSDGKRRGQLPILPITGQLDQPVIIGAQWTATQNPLLRLVLAVPQGIEKVTVQEEREGKWIGIAPVVHPDRSPCDLGMNLLQYRGLQPTRLRLECRSGICLITSEPVEVPARVQAPPPTPIDLGTTRVEWRLDERDQFRVAFPDLPEGTQVLVEELPPLGEPRPLHLPVTLRPGIPIYMSINREQLLNRGEGPSHLRLRAERDARPVYSPVLELVACPRVTTPAAPAPPQVPGRYVVHAVDADGNPVDITW